MAFFTEFRADDHANPYMICYFSTLKYRLADGLTLGIEQEAGWCEQCQSFGIVERVPSVEELLERIEELKSPTEKHRFLLRTDDAIRGAIDELELRLKWRKSRKSPPRCLTCSSTTIEPVRFGEDRSCVVNGRRLVESGMGFADTADWIAEFSSEGLVSDGQIGAGKM